MIRFCIFSFLCLSAWSCQAQKQTIETTTVVNQAVISIPIPDNLTFAGEKVPLDDPDVRERLEKELISNAYRHANNLLLIKKQHRWRASITQLLCDAGIPADFYYLAMAESDLDWHAVSPKGATGFWQFMDETGKEFDLEISKHVDERKDPLLSTMAAAKYLNQAYKKFGNWTIVAASYNRGMNGMDKALEGQKVSSYYDLYLNQETSRYIFRILALKLIVENPEKYGFCIEEYQKYKPLEYQEVEITKSIPNLIDFAQKYGINYKVLKIYNPWLDSSSYELPVSNKKTYKIRLPKDAKLKP